MTVKPLSKSLPLGDFFQMSENEAATTASVASSKYPVDKAWETILLCHYYSFTSITWGVCFRWLLHATFKPLTLFFFWKPQNKNNLPKMFSQRNDSKMYNNYHYEQHFAAGQESQSIIMIIHWSVNEIVWDVHKLYMYLYAHTDNLAKVENKNY